MAIKCFMAHVIMNLLLAMYNEYDNTTEAHGAPCKQIKCLCIIKRKEANAKTFPLTHYT